MRKSLASSRAAEANAAEVGKMKISKHLQRKCYLRRNSKAMDDFSE